MAEQTGLEAKTIHRQNEYDREVFNGDLGHMVSIDDEDGALVVTFDGREVAYPFGELDTLVTAFAARGPGRDCRGSRGGTAPMR